MCLSYSLNIYKKQKQSRDIILPSWYRLSSRNTKFSKYEVFRSEYLVFQIQCAKHLVLQNSWFEIPRFSIEINVCDQNILFLIWNTKYLKNMWHQYSICISNTWKNLRFERAIFEFTCIWHNRRLHIIYRLISFNRSLPDCSQKRAEINSEIEFCAIWMVGQNAVLTSQIAFEWLSQESVSLCVSNMACKLR